MLMVTPPKFGTVTVNGRERQTGTLPVVDAPSQWAGGGGGMTAQTYGDFRQSRHDPGVGAAAIAHAVYFACGNASRTISLK
jgi:hypothetical protein